ncbi:Nif3-like dinuclear metal center hexameric protein [bacterium]|nr:MAG: Nif3-like dinuclear metal center hexameric protein [bacterium]
MMLTVRHITEFLEHRALPSLKLSYDNVGLQAGEFEAEVKSIITTLDVTDAVIDEAIEKQANLIVAHHPIIFPTISAVNNSTEAGRLLLKLIKNNIHLFVSHTNLDSIKGGVSFVLAEKLGLTQTQFLASAESQLQTVHLSFGKTLLSTFEKFLGEFKQPIYSKQLTEEKDRVFVELLISETDAAQLHQNCTKNDGFRFLKVSSSHKNPEFGMGAIGELPIGLPMSAEKFKSYVCEQLGIQSFRFTGTRNTIRKVAVCGGSGSSLLKQAIRQKADAYITADIKYHDFFVADSDLLYMDIGHFETEHFIAETLQRLLQGAFPRIPVLQTSVHTNPMQVYVHGKENKSNPLTKKKAQ